MKKSRRFENLLIALVASILFSIAFGQTESQDVTVIHFNEFEEFAIKEDKGGSAFYYAQLQEREDELDLIVQLNNQSIEGDPRMIVALDLDTRPTTPKEAYCFPDLFGYNICIVKAQDIKEQQKFLVEVTCSSPCRYSLNLIYQKRIDYSLSLESTNIHLSWVIDLKKCY